MDTQTISINKIMNFLCCDYLDEHGEMTVTVRKAEELGWPASFADENERHLSATEWPSKREDTHYADLVADLAANGFAVPVAINYVDGFFYLVNGHHRIAAAIELGITEIPTVYYPELVTSDTDGNAWGDGSTTSDHK